MVINELASSVNWLVFWFGLERDVLTRDKIDLQGVEFLPEEFGKQWRITFNVDFEPKKRHCFQFVVGPSELIKSINKTVRTYITSIFRKKQA